MTNCIYVLHQNGAKSHYRALIYLCAEDYGGHVRVKFREFTVIRPLLSSLVKGKWDVTRKTIKNIIFLIKLFLTKRKIIVLAIAPYNYRLVFLRYLLRNHTIFYHTSWPYWGDNKFLISNHKNSNLVISIWQNFIEKKVKGIFCATKVCADNLRINYDINVPISVVSHSFDQLIYLPSSRNITCLNGLKFIFVGRLDKCKGVDKILQFANLSKNKNYTFTFVGRGELYGYINNIAKKEKNINLIEFIKDQNKLSDIYKKHDFLLLPSIKQSNGWQELFGMVIIESQSCGLIPICTNHVGPKEIIIHGENGFLLDESSYVDGCIDILSTIDVDTIHSMKNACIENVKKYYMSNISSSWREIIHSYIT